MFSTFRQLQSGPGQGQVVLQSTASPFNRPINAISRLACVYCRSKKVGTTGTEVEAATCGAEDAGDGGLRSKDVTASPQSGSEKSLNIEAGLGRDAIMADSSLLDIDFGLGQPDIAYDAHSAYDGSGGLFFDDIQASDTSPSSTGASMAADQNPASGRAHAPDSDDKAVPASPISRRSQDVQDRTSCLCSEMLEVYETVEVGLVWAQRTSSVVNPSGPLMGPTSPPLLTTSDEFMCQQEVLRSCETWLDRDASHIRSQHAVLIISLLDRLLANIMSMAETSGNGKSKRDESDDDAALASPVSPGRPHHLPIFASGADRGLPVDQWKMNEEEKVHVLKSLLNFRALRLKALLERLSVMAASNRWQMQTIMVQHLLDRLPKNCVIA
ncbi:uncharacterized protein MAM_08407 [Metarhizium album ARSEF 1941]|uniref:Uncharacterized protein n=1 Tax=Metarhizium album (strain ARSEF 1941) TaxID=1081103 RepID=A0A0B2WD57_METAS|nr:uncharacterized protein MAM_08407 [Metarhizium album ARSEF 1941]KHN93736.1 hypothetical protein MAM_08407 [Metarhizium album ARSEF 1941]